jgi:hypothetical protein
VEETDIQSDGNPLSLSPNIYFSLVAPSDSSSRTSGGTFFSDTLPEGAPGITVLVASLPEEESSGLSPEARDLLEKISSADNRSTGDESDGHRHFARFREIFLDDGRGASEKVQSLLELGAERLGVENGYLTRIDADEGVHTVVMFGGDRPPAELPIATDLSDTFCRRVLAEEKGMAIEDAEEQGWASVGSGLREVRILDVSGRPGVRPRGIFRDGVLLRPSSPSQFVRGKRHHVSDAPRGGNRADSGNHGGLTPRLPAHGEAASHSQLEPPCPARIAKSYR